MMKPIASQKMFKDYLSTLSIERKLLFERLRETILVNIPEGFSEILEDKMIEYVVPHSLYPAGYHCNPSHPLPFASIANQKNSITLYHFGLYSDKELLSWFVTEYPKYSTTRINMGKSCVRFNPKKEIPFELIGKLMKKMSVAQWIDLYSKHDPRNSGN